MNCAQRWGSPCHEGRLRILFDAWCQIAHRFANTEPPRHCLQFNTILPQYNKAFSDRTRVNYLKQVLKTKSIN